jgi:hypothetical protein
MSETAISKVVVPSTHPSAWKRIVLALVIFGSGCIVGSGATVFIVHRRIMESIHSPETVPPKVAAHLRRFLDLTDEQTEQVTAILEGRRLAIQSIRREFQPQIEQELDQVQAEIAAILNDEQRQRWQQHFTQMRSVWLPQLPK